MNDTALSAGPGAAHTLDLDQSIELARRARAGDRRALGELLERYVSRVRRIAHVRMGSHVREFVDSEDLVQNTLLVATRRIGDFEVRSHAALVRWFAQLLENQIRQAAEYARAECRDPDRRAPLPTRGEDSSGSIALARAEPSPSEDAGAAELRELYDQTVGRLDGPQREVVLLVEYEGADWVEVAEVLERSVPASQELYRRARIRLATLLRGRLGGSD